MLAAEAFPETTDIDESALRLVDPNVQRRLGAYRRGGSQFRLPAVVGPLIRYEFGEERRETVGEQKRSNQETEAQTHGVVRAERAHPEAQREQGCHTHDRAPPGSGSAETTPVSSSRLRLMGKLS